MNVNKNYDSISKNEIRLLHCWETRYDVNSEMTKHPQPSDNQNPSFQPGLQGIYTAGLLRAHPEPLEYNALFS